MSQPTNQYSVKLVLSQSKALEKSPELAFLSQLSVSGWRRFASPSAHRKLARSAATSSHHP